MEVGPAELNKNIRKIIKQMEIIITTMSLETNCSRATVKMQK